ncbi:hypothetical protein A2U01_0076364 [Trifolium medium]|uniref:Uncharacterized protein n=1 Tax=Trifolium medium TaxID=97028 RepID=A0A392T3P3_9FABA|nr:hypothetical protein [Trifolium medium]
MASLAWSTVVGKDQKIWTLHGTCIRYQLKTLVPMLQRRRQLHWQLLH